ncbi:helix-turn-helix domain-containing protein [Anaerobacillus sp. HL2]|nr:helix-turn-helix domain-containing protein [Anaerobacillus sp. HL2]
MKKEKRDFIPVTRDIQTQLWVKQRMTKKKQEMNNLVTDLYRELQLMLQTFSSLEATIFLLRLSGYHRVGLTIDQVAHKLLIDRSYTKILFVSSLHRILQTLNLHKEMYPILYSFVNQSLDNNLLTGTARKTLAYLERGYSIVDISRKRNLKQNTIEDHVVKIAMNEPNFLIDEYVSLKAKKMLLQSWKIVGQKV